MSIYSKLYKSASDLVSANNFKTLVGKNMVSTTAAVGEQGVSTITKGGSNIAANIARKTAKGAATTAKVGGAVIAGTAIAAVPTMTGIGLYDYYRNTTALTDEDRRLEFLIKQQEKSLNMGKDITGDPYVDNDPNAYGNTGTTGSGAFNPYIEVYGNDTGKKQTTDTGMGGIGIVLGLAAVAGGGYYIYKNKNKKKK